MKISFPKISLEKFEKKFKPIKRKALKLNIEFSYQITKEETIRTTFPSGAEIDVDFVEIEIIGELPKLNGWEIIAQIDFFKEGNVVNKIREFDAEIFKYSQPLCQHCNLKRTRKTAYILRDESENLIQIGSTCLKDFTGHSNPEAYALFLSNLLFVTEEIQDYERYFFKETVLTKEVIAVSYDIIKRHGYVKTSIDCYSISESTKDRIIKYFAPVPSFDSNHDEQVYLEEYVTPYVNSLREHSDLVDEIINFYKENEGDDFFHNIKVAVQQEIASSKHYGILAYSPMHYDRELERREIKTKKEEELSKLNEKSDFIGEIKIRMEKEITFEKVLATFNNFFGETVLILFRDREDNLIKWFSTSCDYNWAEENFRDKEGNKIFKKCKFTVQNHETYNEVKSTVVNRLSITEIKESN